MATVFAPCPEPKTELGRYRVLSSTAGIRVSPLCLGAMSFGTAWAGFMGSVDEEQTFKLLDAFVDAGGNFIDTANNYQDEQSEEMLGRWMAARDNRDLMVVATKYTNNYRSWQDGRGKTVNYSGNHKKSMFLSVEASLRKLQTTYIDVFYVHWWDWTTSIEELMDALHILVQERKVMYLGISDTPAWIVSAANVYARDNNKTPFSVYQGRWNVMARDFERDIIPMANHFGMALCPWDVLGGGKLQTSKQLAAKAQAGEGLRATFGPEQDDTERDTSAALEKVAAELGIESIQQVALAYVMRKAKNVFPLVGGRKVEHLEDNIQSLSIRLTDEQVAYIEGIKPLDPGFPMNMVGPSPKETGVTGFLLNSFAQLAWPTPSKPFGYK